MITSDSGVMSGLETAFNADFTGSSTGKVAIFSPGTQTTATGASVYLQMQGEDTCTGSLSYKATGLPAGLSISSSTGVISGTPTTAGTSTVTVTGTDSTGPHTDTLAQTVTIPATCTSAVLSYWVEVNSTVTSYVEYSTNVAAYVADTITVKFIATEISGGDTAFYEDDNALNCD